MGVRGKFEPLRLLVVAAGFLTRVPVPSMDLHADDLRRASAFFPLVGLGVAGVGVAVRAGVEPFWGAGVATIAAVAAMVVVTGAFHEDGLADTADGLWGGWHPAARLAIMRDSRIGTYGTIAVLIVLGLRASLLLPLGLPDFARAVACGHVLGRASTLLLARLLPAADSSAATDGSRGVGSSPGVDDSQGAAGSPGAGGSGAVGGSAAPDHLPHDRVEGRAAEERLAVGESGQARRSGRPRLGASIVGSPSAWGIGVAVLVVIATVGLAARAWAPVPLAVGLMVCFGCVRLFRRRLGGITGDALGAANQVVDLAAVVAVVALVRAGLL